MAGHYMSQEEFELLVIALLVTASRREGGTVKWHIEDVATDWAAIQLDSYRDEVNLARDLSDAVSFLFESVEDEDIDLDLDTAIHFAHFTSKFDPDGNPKKRGVLHRIGLRGSRFDQSGFRPERVEDYQKGLLRFARLQKEGLVRMEHLAPSGWVIPYANLVFPG